MSLSAYRLILKYAYWRDVQGLFWRDEEKFFLLGEEGHLQLPQGLPPVTDAVFGGLVQLGHRGLIGRHDKHRVIAKPPGAPGFPADKTGQLPPGGDEAAVRESKGHGTDKAGGPLLLRGHA